MSYSNLNVFPLPVLSTDLFRKLSMNFNLNELFNEISMYYREDKCDWMGGEAQYYCNLCREEGGVVITSSEIKMIKHIQRHHPELNLVVNIGSGNPGGGELQEKLVKNVNSDKETALDANSNRKYNNKPLSQEDIFYPCDDCSDIYMSLREFTNHKLSHKEKKEEEAVQIEAKKKEKPSNLKGSRIVNRHREKRIVQEYQCAICPRTFSVKDGHENFRNHVLSHYYKIFHPHLPSSKPYKCPLCQKPNRDKATLVRHYAFGHQKLYELTEVTPQDLYYI